MSEISVLVPSYNHAQFVERTLRSIFKQTLVPKKLIVIDDGSKDESVEIIKRVLKDCPFENELITRENRGLCVTLNEGFAKTDSEFFAYLGSDDVWFPEFLSKRLELLRQKPSAVLAFGHSYLTDEQDQVIDSTSDWTEYIDGDMQPLLLKGILFAAPSVVYRHSAVAKHGWNANAKLEDYELYLKLSSDGDFAYDPSVLCEWRQHKTNASKNLPVMLNEWVNSQNRVADQLGISADDLRKIQTKLKFSAVTNFSRHGFKREAASLFWENRQGANSALEFVSSIIRLLIPKSLYRFYRKRRRKKQIRKYRRLGK